MTLFLLSVKHKSEVQQNVHAALFHREKSVSGLPTRVRFERSVMDCSWSDSADRGQTEVKLLLVIAADSAGKLQPHEPENPLQSHLMSLC